MGLTHNSIMANSKQHTNSRLGIEQAEALQATLYSAANQALLKAMESDEVTPALLLIEIQSMTRKNFRARVLIILHSKSLQTQSSIS